MNSAPSDPATPSRRGVADDFAALLAAAILLFVPIAAARGAHPWGFDERIVPTPIALAIVIGGVALRAASRRLRADRFALAAAGVVVAASAFLRDDPRRVLLLGLAPLLLSPLAPLPKLRTTASAGAGVAVGAVLAFVAASRPSLERFLLVALALALAASALLTAPSPPPTRARFDLRAALATGVLLTLGLQLGLAAAEAIPYATIPRGFGGVGAGSGAPLLAAIVLGVASGGVGTALLRPSPRVSGTLLLVGLGANVLGFVGLSVASLAIPSALVAAIGAGIASALSARRLSRAARDVGPLALGVGIVGGPILAGGLARAFSRPLPGLISVPGAEISRRTDWAFVIGFYALLAGVLVLAHLAFAYEFGRAALDPEDGTDRLPIKRKGLRRAG